jgi:hypothetical protein
VLFGWFGGIRSVEAGEEEGEEEPVARGQHGGVCGYKYMLK